ncbi:unnamed protein product [Trichogramma brassicae]|uniref:Uncharacterized protein n=1 Tax=Trichogramma brassicae TaxID=86971 RepID=A0A6H5IZR0_9HYME|nr:unnamed protein product [Trichogramma brassicae]
MRDHDPPIISPIKIFSSASGCVGSVGVQLVVLNVVTVGSAVRRQSTSNGQQRLILGIRNAKEILKSKLEEVNPEVQDELTKQMEKILRNSARIKVANNSTDFVNNVLQKTSTGSVEGSIDKILKSSAFNFLVAGLQTSSAFNFLVAGLSNVSSKSNEAGVSAILYLLYSRARQVRLIL